MSTELEIERKFLVGFPDLKKLNVKRKIRIVQTYLQDGNNNSQRRVRFTEENGAIRYVYTEKIFLTDITRQENEYEISKPEYQHLIINEKKNSCVPILKVRYCFEYENQMFELDTYPFSDRFAILEIELENPEQKISFPDNLKIIKEVTGISIYSNAALANAGAFPE